MEVASRKAYGRKRCIPRKYLFPYDLVERGDQGKALKKREATREEYVLGLKHMEAQRRCQGTRKRSRRITWETVRRYSEETFTTIADGRLPQGWDDQAAIYILRIEVIAATGKAPVHSHAHAAASKTADRPRHQADTKNSYDRTGMGAPCRPWNQAMRPGRLRQSRERRVARGAPKPTRTRM